MFGRTPPSSRPEIDSLIGIAARIEGDLVFSGGLRIDGEVLGNVIATEGPDHMLVVSEHARIEGAVSCAILVVNGYIAGQVRVSEVLELQPKARIVGDVHYKLLEMQGGAVVTGALKHQPDSPAQFHLAEEAPSAA